MTPLRRSAIMFSRRHCRLGPVAAAALLAAAAAALLAAATAALPSRPLIAQSAEAEPNRLGFAPVVGVRVGVPQQLSLTVGAGHWRYRADGDRIHIAFVAVEPGLGAGRISVGYFRGHGNLLAGAAVRASALRTWRDPWSVAPNRTYVGLEASGHAIFSARVGLFHRASSGSGRPLLLTWDLGLMF